MEAEIASQMAHIANNLLVPTLAETNNFYHLGLTRFGVSMRLDQNPTTGLYAIRTDNSGLAMYFAPVWAILKTTGLWQHLRQSADGLLVTNTFIDWMDKLSIDFVMHAEHHFNDWSQLDFTARHTTALGAINEFKTYTGWQQWAATHPAVGSESLVQNAGGTYLERHGSLHVMALWPKMRTDWFPEFAPYPNQAAAATRYATRIAALLANNPNAAPGAHFKDTAYRTPAQIGQTINPTTGVYSGSTCICIQALPPSIDLIADGTSPRAVSGLADPGATVKVYADGSATAYATVTANALGGWVIPAGYTGPNGLHFLRATAELSACPGVSVLGAPEPFTITTSSVLPVVPTISNEPTNTANQSGTALVQINGIGAPGETVSLYSGATLLGTAVVGLGGDWVISLSQTPGDYTLTATATNSSATSLPSAPQSYSVIPSTVSIDQVTANVTGEITVNASNCSPGAVVSYVFTPGGIVTSPCGVPAVFQGGASGSTYSVAAFQTLNGKQSPSQGGTSVFIPFTDDDPYSSVLGNRLSISCVTYRPGMTQ
jgi:hypothetical protein